MSDILTPQEWARYRWLQDGRRANVITEAELAELIAFSTRLEAANIDLAEKAAAAAEKEWEEGAG